ncbi:MAG TPA: MOSC domain-containing protein [Chloroflexota bacterium]|jgi:MOSC domain-containing protein YiiM|nr:MOSC domain-containing protein [Chloroflexota bacterium]
MMQGTLRSVQVGRPREFEFNGRPARSAIWKSPVLGPVALRGVNLEGDDQADREAHGGPNKAVYAYATEDYEWWAMQLGRPLETGEFGENLTTVGIDVSGARVGERWSLGTTVLEVSEPRVPCWRLGVRMNDKLFPRRFTEALRPGAYLRVITAGYLAAGDSVRVESRPDHDLSIQDVFRIYSRDRDQAGRLLSVPQLSEPWRAWARQVLEHPKTGRSEHSG